MQLRFFAVVALVIGALATPCAFGAPSAHGATAELPPPTFTKDVALIVFSHCAACHRPGGSGPFSLLTYADLRPRARQIATAVSRRSMPPWKPEPGYGEFRGERRLSDRDIAILVRWASEGAIEGDPAALPAQPTWPDTWQLGPPDLVLTMPEPYTLPGTGPDRFRNFVIPIPIPEHRYVKAWELRPGNGAIVHHATIHFDPTSSTRQLDEQDPQPGYEGIAPFSVEDPDGYFLGWTPGEQPSLSGQDIPWSLEKGSDLVLMLHMMPSGKPETIQASLGLYFTDQPPARTPALLRLCRQDIDIPPGEKRYTIRDSYTLPVEADLYSVYPHAHYLAKEIKADATLPDGSTRRLLYIKDWDFNWQDVYHYKDPIYLPAGTTLSMEFTYDNSAENVRNPRRPPVEVIYGKNSTDEMGDLWVQVVPHNAADLARLKEEFKRKLLPETIAGIEMMLRADPSDRGLHDEVALMYQKTHDMERAVAHFANSLRLAPSSPAAHYNLGSTLLNAGKPDQAHPHLQEAIRLKPDYAAAYSNLGLVHQQQHKLNDAVTAYREALRLDPADPGTHYNLGIALHGQEKVSEAIVEYREALRLGFTHPGGHYMLGVALESRANLRDAVAEYRAAIAASPEWPLPLLKLSWVLATTADPAVRRPGEALSLCERLLKVASPPPAAALDALAASLAALGEFDRAVTAAQSALAIATAAHDDQAAAGIRERLDLYREHKPFIGAY